LKKANKVAILIFVMIVAVVILAYIFVYSEETENINHDIFTVNDEFDDARAFIVTLNDIFSETEHGATLELNPTYSFGVRFTNVSIPSNATLVDSYVEIFSTSTPGIDRPNCKIYCDNVDNAVNFTNAGVLNISGRNYTENFSNWNTTVPYGKWINAPSIKAQIQEVISRENWTSGNSIAVLFVTNGYNDYAATFQSYERGYPAKLHIKWK